jgi:hypothetical protein
MKRREFITLLGGAAVAWPLAARAQQAERVRRIGVLVPFAENDPLTQARVMAFQQGLQELGWMQLYCPAPRGHPRRTHSVRQSFGCGLLSARAPRAATAPPRRRQG